MIWLDLFGRNPKGERLEKIKNSKNYNSSKQTFQNKRSNDFDNMIKKLSFFKILRKFLTNKTKRAPAKNLPTKNNIQEFINSKKEISYIWLGHSTVLLKFSQKFILFDPVFKSAAPFSFIKKRFQPSPISLIDLPKIDFIIISHDHYDHLETSTIKFLNKRDNPIFFAPLGVGEHLNMWEISNDKINEMDWGESLKIDNLEFFSTPSMHSSGRMIFSQNKTLWCSWIIKSFDKKIFFSGDSGYDSHFEKIGSEHGPFDLVFMECGQYNKMWHLSHMYPTESLKAFEDLKGTKLQTIHWGAFDLALHSWNEPINIIYNLALEKKIDLLHPMQGELVELDKERKNITWWK